MTHWILFSTLATALFYGLYSLMLKHDRWLQLSRWYLIGSLVFSLVYPLVPLPDIGLPTPSSSMLAAEPLAPAEVPPETTLQAPPTAEGTWLPLAIYVAGAAATLLFLLIQVGRILLRMRREHVTMLDDDTPPFSFFNHIIVGVKGMDNEELQCVLAHEREHVRLHHTEDVLLMRLLCCAAWFNPFAWLILRELRAVHEYQADAAVAASHDTHDYLRLLYRQATGIGYGHIIHNFNSINLKNRIVMMNKKKTRFGAWKLLATLPLALLLTAVGCQTANAKPSEVQTGEALITVTYNRTGGKPLPFGGIGYNSIRSQWDPTLREVQVNCNGKGAEQSYGAWEIDPFTTSRGLVDGKVLRRNERKVIQSVDRKLRRGHASGTLRRTTTVKTESGKVTLNFDATWLNGTPQGDATIKLQVAEVKMPEESMQTVMGQSDEIYQVVEEMPEYPGGIEAMYKYLAENIHYPAKAKEEGIEGRVYVVFVVEKDGRLSNIKVLRNIGGGCDEEAMRVVEAMPRWNPGRHQGKAVRVHFILPIVFKLS